MGTKHTKPIIDVHTVQQRLSRNELVYLKNLFIFLCHHASPSSSSSSAGGSSSASSAAPPPHLNQSQSSAALASPSNLELMALRLPRALVLRHLLSPSFPSLSPAMLERCFAIFDYHGYGSGLDYSEYLVMMWTLWHSNPHDELARFLFVLCDPGQSGRVAAKHYRRVATALWTDQAAYCAAGKDAAGGTAATGAAFLGLTGAVASTAKDPTAKGGAAEREWLTAMFDFYFVLACFHYDRDHDNVLNLNEFGNFAADDLLLSSFLSRQTDSRQMKQRLHQQLGVTAATLAAMAGGGSAGAAAQQSSTSSSAAASLPLATRTFLGEAELEESSGAIWRAQRRNTLKIATRRASLGAQQPAAAPAPAAQAPSAQAVR